MPIGDFLFTAHPFVQGMSDVIVIGGGPSGLSTALFTAKNGLDTIVFDTDETWMHSAYLRNYLGIDGIDGSTFMEIARGQVAHYGADRYQGEEVSAVERTADGFVVTAADSEYRSGYVVFATGTDRDLPAALGCDLAEDGTVRVDADMATSIADAYAVGSTVRSDKYQAAISVGSGAAAALDILSTEEGRPVHDFDTPNDT